MKITLSNRRMREKIVAENEQLDRLLQEEQEWDGIDTCLYDEVSMRRAYELGRAHERNKL